MDQFIGRKDELKRLHDTWVFDRPCLIVVKGRRRVGKSRLIKEFGADKRFLSFTGVAPVEAATAQDQRDRFSKQLAEQLGIQQKNYTSWTNAFYDLTTHLTDEPTVLLFDEISWMATGDPLFVPDLKIWWDLKLQEYSHLRLVFCGSVSTWIEKNIINSTALFGRITLILTLKQLSLPACAQFLQARGFKGSFDDIFSILAVTGGVPWYLQQIASDSLADENIKRLCFSPDGALVKEFDRIFHDLFNGRSSAYKKIMYLLADGMKDLQGIQSVLALPSDDELAGLMDDLVAAGFVSRHYSWSIKTGKACNPGSLYRLSDNYVRFFIKYIEPNINKINEGGYHELSLQSLPAWNAIMGFQVENLLLNNRALLIKSLGVNPMDIVADNPYILRPTKEQKGCQIDYLVQTQTKSLLVCEFKFNLRELGLEIIDSMEEKMARFAPPQGFGVVPVLFHFGGVKNAVHLKNYFYRIIDITTFLKD